jgi:hypothetical protein
MQQAPPHRLGPQLVPVPRKVPPSDEQCAEFSTLQVASLKQQAPHGFGVQFVPSPWKRPFDVVQLASVRTSQLPLEKQQAPVVGAIGDI